MNQNKISEILNLHLLWISNDPKGQCADLASANLHKASLECANLYKANLEFANLECASLRGANLEFVSLRGATFNKKTVFPEGFDPIVRGMIFVGEEQEELKEPAAPSTSEQEKEETVVVAAVPAAVLPKTLHDELSEVFAKHGLVLVSFRAKPGKVRASKA